jgi:hypothetical protein
MPHDLAPMLVMIVGILTTGGVIVFRPLSKRLAELLHTMSQERLAGRSGPENERLQATIAALEQRISLLEERQNFTESLLDRRLPQPETSYNGSVGPVETARRLQQ